MRLVKNILLFLIVLYIGIVAFMPKENLYYYLEKKLFDNYQIIIHNEKINSSLTKFEIYHPKISYQDIDIAQINKVTITPLLFFNKIEAINIDLLNIAKDTLNLSISSLIAKHTILNPFYIKLDIVGNFGVGAGYIDLKNKILHINIIKEKDISSIKQYLSKNKQGWYYEYKF